MSNDRYRMSRSTGDKLRGACVHLVSTKLMLQVDCSL